MFQSVVFLTKVGHKLLFALFSQPDMCESVGKIGVRTLCFMHVGIFRHNYINNDAYFLHLAHRNSL